MRVEENTKSLLTVFNLGDVDEGFVVKDSETGEIANVIAQTFSGQLLIQWQNFVESEDHKEFELISTLAPNVKVLEVSKGGKTQLKTNPFSLFGKKKKFYVDFWEGEGTDDEFHQTTITAKNEATALKIAKRGYKNFVLDSIEEIQE